MKKYLAVFFVFVFLILVAFGLGALERDFKLARYNFLDFDLKSVKWSEASFHHLFYILGTAKNCQTIVSHYDGSSDDSSKCVSAFSLWKKWGFDNNDDFHPIWLTWLYWQDNPNKFPLSFNDWHDGISGMNNSWSDFMDNYEGPLDDIYNPCHEIVLHYILASEWPTYSQKYKSCEEKFQAFDEFSYDDPEHPLRLFWQQWNTDQTWDTEEGEQKLIPPPLFEQWEIGAGLLAESEWNFSKQPFFSSLPGFGGRISSIVDCNCSGNTLFYMTPVPGSWSGPYLVDPGDVHLFNNISPGNWVLGNVNSGGVCLVVSRTGCDTIPTMFKVQPRPAGVGTS